MNAKKVFLPKPVAQCYKIFWQSLPRKGQTWFLSVIFSPGGPVQCGRTGQFSTKQSLRLLSKYALNCACRVDRGLQVFLHPIYIPTKTYSYLCMNNVLKKHTHKKKKGKRDFDFAEKVEELVFF